MCLLLPSPRNQPALQALEHGVIFEVKCAVCSAQAEAALRGGKVRGRARWGGCPAFRRTLGFQISAALHPTPSYN